MNRTQIIFSILLTAVSLAVGYYLSQWAQRNANRIFLQTLREELDLVDEHYKTDPNLDEATRIYLRARHDYLEARLKTLESKV